MAKVGSTNKNPHVVAHYVVRAIFNLNQIPCTVRGDRGTENIHIARMQRFLRRDGEDAFSSVNSFMYGRSIADRLIEAWCSVLKKTMHKLSQ